MNQPILDEIFSLKTNINIIKSKDEKSKEIKEVLYTIRLFSFCENLKKAVSIPYVKMMTKNDTYA